MENARDNIIAMLPENAESLIQRLRNKEAPTDAEPAEPDPQRPAAPAAPATPPAPQRRS
jgi:membrane protein required for colicin V production